MKIILYTDGGTKGGNPGEGYGSFFLCSDDTQLWGNNDFGPSTSNEAEYASLIIGLKAVRDKFGLDVDLEIKIDSALLIGQLRLNRPWKVKAANLLPFVVEAKGLLSEFTSWKMVKVPREEVMAILGH